MNYWCRVKCLIKSIGDCKCWVLRIITHIVLVGSIGANFAHAHSGDDPNRKLEKLNEQIQSYHAEFKELSDVTEQKKNLAQQIKGIRSTLLLLRNELSGTRASRCVKKDDEIDYFKALDKALKASQKALRQLTDVIDEAGVAESSK